MHDFNRMGPKGMGQRSRRGMGNMTNTKEQAQRAEPGMGQNMGQNMRQNMGQETGQDMGQGRCCRHGQRHGSMNDSCAMRGAEAGRGMGQGRNGAMRQQCRYGAGQPQTGTAPSAEAGSDGAENNS